MSRAFVIAGWTLVVCCGGKAVIDGFQGAGGAGGSGSHNSASAASEGSTFTGISIVSSSMASTGSGVKHCGSPADCPGAVCEFDSGACLPACTNGQCPQGMHCDPCASSSCPGCDNCLAACLPNGGAKLCADHGDCPKGSLCVYQLNSCYKECATGNPNAVCDSMTVCQQCITSSCKGCKDCRAACVGQK